MTRYLDLADFAVIAGSVLGVEPEVALRVMRADLADSALHAPAAGFGEVEFYPDLIDKAAVLCAHLCWNHSLPDGNKRSAWTSAVVFLDLNGVEVSSGADDDEDEDEDEDEDAYSLLLALAEHKADVPDISALLRARSASGKEDDDA